MHLPVLIQDLAVILGVAAVVTFLFRRIKQPVVLGYITAGIIVGPYTPAIFSVSDTHSIQVWAELGVIFLMFNLGLEFSFRRLARVGLSAGTTAVIQMVAMLFWGFVAAKILAWPKMDAVFLGCMISISSTTIIIKALEELGLKKKKFAELVFGILIVEDLAAILMLVALTNIATTSQIDGIKLLLAAGKLALVVGAWFLVGMFFVPRFVHSVSRHGNDEILTVVAIGLCLALVSFAANFQYSAALGAFIMGSILAESSQSKRIEHLVKPLKDIFGAVFFVSVGMLLNPNTIVENLGAVLLISTTIILGKLLAVTFGAFVTGQTLRNSVQTGFSMAQIGEFSFIIASLGLSYGVLSAKVYPIIVASSLITTFTTPYLIKLSDPFALALESFIPTRMRATLDNYVTWMQRRSVNADSRERLLRNLTKWGLNAVVVITLFTLGAEKLIPITESYLEHRYSARAVAWLLAFVLCAPSIWAMLSIFREAQRDRDQRRTLPKGGALLLSRLITVGLVGLLSAAYFPLFATILITVGVCSFVFMVFRRQVENYYRWFEQQFKSGFQAPANLQTREGKELDRLAPWDAHLVELTVPARSFLVGRSLLDLKLREHYGLNVVVIVRGSENIVAPPANEPLYPGDRILCFATDAEIERFKLDIEPGKDGQWPPKGLDGYDLRRLQVHSDSPLCGISIRQSGIREQHACIVVGLERQGQRIRSPSSFMDLAPDDVLWVVGERNKLHGLEPLFHRPRS